MNDEVNKSKNIELKNRLNDIRIQLTKLNEDYVTIYNDLRTDIIIDKKTIEQDNLQKINQNNISVLKEINNVVIPIINNNI